MTEAGEVSLGVTFVNSLTPFTLLNRRRHCQPHATGAGTMFVPIPISNPQFSISDFQWRQPVAADTVLDGIAHKHVDSLFWYRNLT